MTDFNSEAIAYCHKFDIPIKHFFEILHDQKVIPMIRGKVIPSEIAENGFIPRTPYMLLKNDSKWLSLAILIQTTSAMRGMSNMMGIIVITLCLYCNENLFSKKTTEHALRH